MDIRKPASFRLLFLLLPLALLAVWLFVAARGRLFANQPQSKGPSGASSQQEFFSLLANPQDQPTALPNGMVIGNDSRHDVSPELRHIPPKPIVKSDHDEVQDEVEND